MSYQVENNKLFTMWLTKEEKKALMDESKRTNTKISVMIRNAVINPIINRK